MDEQQDWLASFDPFASEGDFTINFTDPIAGLISNPTPVQTKHQLDEPIITSRRVAKRQHTINLKREALAKLITRLPDEDEIIYVVGNGDGREGRMGATLASGFDYGSFVPVLADMLGVGSVLHISTWVMNRDTATEFVRMLDEERLYALYLLTDPYFRAKGSTAPIANTLIAEFARFGASRARFMAFQNHTKILCIRNAANDRFVTITGSSNLTSVQRCEQYVLDGNPDTYHFFIDQFFDPMLRKATA